MILRLIFCSLFVAASGRECTDKGERLELLLKLTMLHFNFRGVHPGLSMSSVRGGQQENRFHSEINFIFSILYLLPVFALPLHTISPPGQEDYVNKLIC